MQTPNAQIEAGRAAFLKLLETSEALVTQRFQDVLDTVTGFIPIQERVTLLKVYGTIRLAMGQQIGQTTAALDFVDKRYRGCRTIYLCPRIPSGEKRSFPGTDFCSWNQVGFKDPRGVRAIFVDPGPHAGPVARDAIYQCAAEAMATPDGGFAPVVVYFIGT